MSTHNLISDLIERIPRSIAKANLTKGSLIDGSLYKRAAALCTDPKRAGELYLKEIAIYCNIKIFLFESRI